MKILNLIFGVVLGQNKNVTHRIIGGNEDRIENIPWLVSLWAPGGSANNLPNHCGGAIIHENWILTAAHCFWSNQPVNYRL